MSYFPNAFKKVFIATGGVVTSGDTSVLKGGQVGLFDAKTYKALSLSESKKSAHKEVILAQGSFHTRDQISPFLGGLKEPVQSRVINGNYTTRFVVAHPVRPKNHVISVGWDGVSTCKTISGQLNSDYYLRIEIKNSPVLRAYNRNLYRVIHVHTRCGDPCTSACDEPEDRHWIADQLVSQINSDPELKYFVKAEKIFTPDQSIPAGNVSFTVYRLTVCDTGDSFALAAVQSQYPTLEISRVERNGSNSVYELCRVTSGGAPAAFTTGAIKVIPGCASCPAGYTLVPVAYKFVVRKSEAIPANIGTAESSITSTYSAVQTVYMGNEANVSTYIIYKSTAVTPTASGTDVVINTGEVVESFCSLDTPTNVSWVSAGLRYKTVRTLCLTVAKDCPGTSVQFPGTTTTTTTSTTTSTTTTANPASVLGQLLAFYANSASIVPGSIKLRTAGECADIYELQQYNNACLLDGCGSEAVPEFDTVQSFRGATWDECPCQTEPAIDSTSLVGIRLTGAYVDTKFGNCSFEPEDHFEVEPVFLIASLVDSTGDICDKTDWAVTELQVGQTPSGTGEQLLRDLILFQGYRQERWQCDPRMREVLDINSANLDIVNRSKFYKIYYIFHNVPYMNRHTNLFDNEQYVLAVAFPEEADTSSFEQLVGSYLASNNVFLESY